MNMKDRQEGKESTPNPKNSQIQNNINQKKIADSDLSEQSEGSADGITIPATKIVIHGKGWDRPDKNQVNNKKNTGKGKGQNLDI
jgi:hypothetical protein